MTNDQRPMTKECPMSNDQKPIIGAVGAGAESTEPLGGVVGTFRASAWDRRHWSLHHSLGIASLVIGHFPSLQL
jgi:hypothetical protein